VCLAFGALLLANPHYLTQPGFQLSFSAIFGLVWAFGDAKYERRGWLDKVWRAARALLLTSIIATIWTAPFIAYHFHSIPVYSLIGNLILLPIFSLAIMPLVMIGAISVWLGFNFPLAAANAAYNFALHLAQKIAGLPHAMTIVPTGSGTALLLMVIGFLCLMFANGKRIKIFLSTGFAAAALLTVAARPKPVFYATADHELIARRAPDGKLEFNKGKSSGHYFAFDSWKQFNDEPAGTPNRRMKCEHGACMIETKNWKLAYIQKFAPLAQNLEGLCARPKQYDFIVSYFRIDAPNCAAEIPNGGFVIYESGRIEYSPNGRIWHGARNQ
jgi:competence protein ComEC